MTSYLHEIHIPYHDSLKADLKIRLKNIIGHPGDFDDSIWIGMNFSNYKKSCENTAKLYFTNIPLQYTNIIKYFCLRHKMASNSYSTYIKVWRFFTNFVVKNYGEIPLKNINSIILSQYSQHLNSLVNKFTPETITSRWTHLEIIFNSMSDFPIMPNVIFPKFRLTTSNKELDVTNSEITNYVPKDKLIELDRLFIDFKDIIPVHIQTIYWLLRLIPSRISDILEMNLTTALRPFNDKYIITIPIPKTSESQSEYKKKMIYINYISDVEKFLIDLIKKQIDISKDLQSKVNDKDLLFSSYRYVLWKCKVNGFNFFKGNEIVCTYRGKYFNKILKRIILMADNIVSCLGVKKYNFRDSSGNLYNITSHCLRHEGITSRIDSGLFTTQQVMVLSGLESENTLWGTYYHRTEKSQKLLKTPPVYKGDLNNSISEQAVYNDDIKFIGNPRYNNEVLLKKLMKVRHEAPIIDNQGNWYGTCQYFNDCKKLKKGCLGCDLAQYDNVDISSIEMSIDFWENECKWLSSQGSSIQLKEAIETLKRYKKILERYGECI